MLPVTPAAGVVEGALAGFVDNLVAAIPRILTGLVFLAVSTVLVKGVMLVVRVALRRVFHDQPIYVQLSSTIVAAFLWFGVILAFLTAVGLGQIAAALGTASGFLALGVSYALSDMIKDAVAGVYLLRDPDFNPGDRVVAGDVEGVVRTIELRKTRFEVGDDTVVRANAEVEKKWTRKADEASEAPSDVA